MKMKCQMMMRMEVKPTDPAALMALRDQLKLTDEQMAAIDNLLSETREAAAKILTEDQRNELTAVDKLPATCMEMHQTMMKKMKEKGGSMGKDGMMCPMMQAMKHGKIDEKGQSHQQHHPQGQTGEH